MDLPQAETEPETHQAHRSGVVVAVLALVLFAVAGVTVSSVVGQHTTRVIDSSAALHPTATTAAATTTTTTTRVKVVPTTEPATPTTSRPVVLSASPATSTPTTAVHSTTTIAKTASLRLSLSRANFPTTPPPYSPMPIEQVTVTNTGGVTIRSIVVHPVGVYSVPSSTCTTLSPGQSCVARVQFCPSSPNHYLDTLVVTGEDVVTGRLLQASILLNGIAT
jgi:hypothetical protein